MSTDMGRFNGLAPAVRPASHSQGFDSSTYNSLGGRADSAQGEASFGEILRGIRARWYAVIVPPLVSMMLVGAYCWMQDPLFTARSLIEIRGYAPLLAAATVENMYGADTRKLEYQKTTIAKLKQPGVAERVLTDDALMKDLAAYFGIKLGDGTSAEPPVPSRKLVSSYLGLIDINPVSETSLVEIEATTRDPNLSARVANAHAAGFIEALRAERRESMRTNISALELQEAELRQRLTEADRAMAEYSEESHLLVTHAGDTKDVALQKLMGLNELLADATEKRLRTEGLYSRLATADIKKSTALDTETIRDTLTQLETMETQYAALGEKVTPEYPEMRDLKARVDALRNSVTRQRQQLFADLKLKLDGEKAAEERLTAQISAEEKSLNVNSKKMGKLLILRKESDSFRQLYENVLKQLQETKISASSGVSNIFLSDVARPAFDSAYPKTKLFVVLGGLLGLALGLAYAIAAELIDSRIKSSEDATRALGVPVLGVLPRFMEQGTRRLAMFSRAKKLLPWKIESVSAPQAVPAAHGPSDVSPAAESSMTAAQNDDTVRPLPHKMDFVVVEALKTIRAGILLSSIDTPVRTIVVTSANKGEGKSTFAVNLAASLAQAEYKTLLVDADLRESCLKDVFPQLTGKGGLSEMLAGNPEQIGIEPVPFAPFMDILPSGVRPPNPAEMLGSKRMVEALQSFRKTYDFVIVDSPPVLPVADTLMVAHQAEGVIVVTRSGRTQRRHAREALQRLQRVRANVLGVVVNDSDLNREEVYGSPDNYQYFGGSVVLKKTA